MNKAPKPLKPLVVSGKPLDKVEFQSYCLLRRDKLWSVLTLNIKGKEVVGSSITDGDVQLITLQKLVTKISQGIKEDQGRPRK